MRSRCLPPLAVLLLAALPACALLGSCGLMGSEEPAWTERTLTQAPPRRELLSYCERALAQAGYPAPELDEAASEAYSEWRMELQPFGKAGRRYRATIQVETLEGGGAVLRARVETQMNTELARPMDPARAKWEDAPDDGTRAKVLLQHLTSLLSGSGAAEGGR